MKTHLITDPRKIVISRFYENSKWDGERWILLTTVVIRLEDGRLLFIPAGFVTNFGSIPRFMRFMLDRMGKSIVAFVVHDWLYSILLDSWWPFNDLSRSDCDHILYQLSIQDGESWTDAQLINKGLKLGGWACFKKSDPIMQQPKESVISYMAECNGYKITKDDQS